MYQSPRDRQMKGSWDEGRPYRWQESWWWSELAGTAREEAGWLVGKQGQDGTLVAVVKAKDTVLGGDVLPPRLLWRGQGVEDQVPATPFLPLYFLIPPPCSAFIGIALELGEWSIWTRGPWCKMSGLLKKQRWETRSQKPLPLYKPHSKRKSRKDLNTMSRPSMKSHPAEQRISGVLGGQEEDKWSISA